MPSTKAYYGPFTTMQIDRCIGREFDRVWIKPADNARWRGPQGQRPLTTIGTAWPCGCEVRGGALAVVPTDYWAPCAAHREILDGLPTCELPKRLEGGILIPREAAMYRSDRVLIEAIPGLL
jgi:hypothetical protein